MGMAMERNRALRGSRAGEPCQREAHSKSSALQDSFLCLANGPMKKLESIARISPYILTKLMRFLADIRYNYL
jgi:transcriptional regulator of aromatic amino acid metabolism